jgi:hypothetical protein
LRFNTNIVDNTPQVCPNIGMKDTKRTVYIDDDLKDLTGRRFSRLVAVKFHGNTPSGAKWECLCDCGNRKIVTRYQLRSGGTKSCGCLNRDKIVQRNFKHGLTNAPEYPVWANMRQRCVNPKNKAYKYYGGRGIKYCERWESFSNFLADMGKRPDGLTLERINTNGNYEPSNCKWATWSEQRKSQRKQLSDETVNAIRHEYARGEITQAQLAHKHGTTQTSVWRIVRGVSYA